MKRVMAIATAALLTASACTAASVETSSPTSTSLVPTSTLPFSAGAAGIGDLYYPGLGNGGYDVQHYDIDLTYETDGSVGVEVVVTAIATQNLSELNLDFVGWEIDSLTVDGEEADFRRDGEELVIHPSQVSSGDHFAIEVSYHGTPAPMQSAPLPLEILACRPRRRTVRCGRTRCGPLVVPRE